MIDYSINKAEKKRAKIRAFKRTHRLNWLNGLPYKSFISAERIISTTIKIDWLMMVQLPRNTRGSQLFSSLNQSEHSAVFKDGNKIVSALIF